MLTDVCFSIRETGKVTENYSPRMSSLRDIKLSNLPSFSLRLSTFLQLALLLCLRKTNLKNQQFPYLNLEAFTEFLSKET